MIRMLRTSPPHSNPGAEQSDFGFQARGWIPVILVAFLFASGCAWWHNFSTYFNTLYLAQVHLEAYEAQQRAIIPANANAAIAVANHRWLDEEYQMRQLALREGRSIAITPSFSQSLGATKQITNVHLDSAIILGSKILADKKGSKYVEDALYVVGKAEFYKNDFATARRKFLELIYKYPETKYGSEVQVFLSRSMLSGREFDTAEMALQKGLEYATKVGDKVAISSVHRAIAEFTYSRYPDSLPKIAAELHEAEGGVSGHDLAKLAFEEGSVFFLAGDWSGAERAFQTSYDNSKDEWLSGEAHTQHALALRREERFDEARLELKAVLDRAKFSASHPSARYELAYTNELAARKSVGGNLHSGVFYTDYHRDLDNAYHGIDTTYRNSSALMISHARFRRAEMFREMGMYDSAALAAAQLIGTKDFSTAPMNEFVSQHASSLASFAKWKTELSHTDSIEQRLKIRPAKHEGADIHLQAVRETLGDRWQPQMPVQMTKDDSIRLPQIEERIKHERSLGVEIADTGNFVDSLHFREATAHYQLGRAYETFQEFQSARTEYGTALAFRFPSADTASGALRAQTLYAWMQLEHREKNLTASDSLLKELLSHFGQTIYAEQARVLFASKLHNTRAEQAYSDAYKVMRERGIDAAKILLLDVVSTYDQEDVAPRSLYALGVTYEEQQRYDSANTYYRRILKDYPYSTYAMALRPRYADVSGPLPHASPVIDPTMVSPEDAEQQRLQAEQARQARELQQRQRARPNRPGMPPSALPLPSKGGMQRDSANQNPPNGFVPPRSPFELAPGVKGHK